MRSSRRGPAPRRQRRGRLDRAARLGPSPRRTQKLKKEWGRRPNVQASGRPGVQTSERPDVRASGRPDVRASGRPSVRASERPSIAISLGQHLFCAASLKRRHYLISFLFSFLSSFVCRSFLRPPRRGPRRCGRLAGWRFRAAARGPPPRRPQKLRNKQKGCASQRPNFRIR